MITQVPTGRRCCRGRRRVRLACAHRPCGPARGFSFVLVTWLVNHDLLLTEDSVPASPICWDLLRRVNSVHRAFALPRPPAARPPV